MESVILDLNSTSFNFKCYLLSWSSPEGNCDSSAQEGPLDGLSILYTCVWRLKIEISKSEFSIGLFKILKTCMHRRELRKKFPRGSTGQTFHFNVVEKQKLKFQFGTVNPPFWKSRNLCPDGLMGGWVTGWVGGWWSKESFNFPYFLVR